MFFPKLALISLNNQLCQALSSMNLRKESFSPSFFTNRLLIWYDENKRNLPWRQTNNPYFIWLSEIILQQTRVDQGLPYYNKFVDNFPDVETLAAASQDEVFRLWQGLGYYNRARNLHATAKIIADKYDGIFPVEHDDVISLKGIGDYTAAAIMSFAYNAPYAAVDGNVYRVLSRVFGIEEFTDTSVGKKVFQQLATELLDMKSPGVFNQALMEFGALQCVPKSPDCSACPYQEQCFAHNKDLIKELPRKKGKVKVRNRYFNYLDIRVDNNMFLRKRTEKDIWRGLYEFPLIETGEKVSFSVLMQLEEYKYLLEDTENVEVVYSVSYRHVLSHQVIHAVFYKIEVNTFVADTFVTVGSEAIDGYGVSRLIDKYLEEAEV